MKRTILAAISGAILACSLVLSCSDDSPTTADAHVDCDCPVAEPPLAGRVVRVTENVPIPVQTGVAFSASCAAGATLIGGGCGLDQASNLMTLVESRPDPASDAFLCVWYNPTMVANTGIVTAICLNPAPAN